MFLKAARFLKSQCLTRYVLNNSLIHQCEPLCCAKVPFLLNKAIHTSQVDCRDYTFKPYERPCREDHDHKNMRINRPMSPHLTIYAPCLPAMTSICQRITGNKTRPFLFYQNMLDHNIVVTADRTVATAYVVMLAGGALFLSNGIDSYVSMIQSLNLNSFFILIIKFILGYPFAYHYFCGLRFCMFNIGKLMDRKEVYSSAYQSIVASAVLAFLFALR